MDILLFGPSSSPAENNLSRPWWYEQQIFILTHHFHALMLSQRKVNILYKKGYKISLKIVKLPHFHQKNKYFQLILTIFNFLDSNFFCWFLKIWTHSSSFEYWNNLIERTRLQKNSEIIALEFHAVMKICIRAIHVNIFFRFTTLQIKVGEKKGEEILMTLPANLLIDKLFLHNLVFQKSFELGKNMFFTFFELYLHFEFSWFKVQVF